MGKFWKGYQPNFYFKIKIEGKCIDCGLSSGTYKRCLDCLIKHDQKVKK